MIIAINKPYIPQTDFEMTFAWIDEIKKVISTSEDSTGESENELEGYMVCFFISNYYV